MAVRCSGNRSTLLVVPRALSVGRPPTYPTAQLRVGGTFVRSIETKTGHYDWPLHNKIRTAVYQYMKRGGKGKRFVVTQELRDEGLVVVVTRTE